VDVNAKLDELRRTLEEARSMPMSASVVVNRSEVLALVDEVRAAMAAAFSESQQVVAAKEAVIDEGRHEAEQIVADAHNERDRLISDTDVYRVAKRQADDVLQKAHAEAEELRKETDDYVDAKLANFEITLERTMEAVKRGRERLAGRTELDSLTTEEADRIVLPEHLEG
jgi:cell division septum initiation protein DivIVA